jgi:hypothetical protein
MDGMLAPMNTGIGTAGTLQSFSGPVVRAMHGSSGANCGARATTELTCVGDVAIRGICARHSQQQRA